MVVDMDAPAANTALVIALHRALEAGQHGAALAHLFTDDAVTIGHPSLINPRGWRVERDGMLANSSAGANLLSRQTYDVRSVIEHGQTVVVRLLWTGTIARDEGPFHAGQQLTAHVAQFIEVRDGRIASIETYDCYEPFG
jgi:ketosteroid isomerase-like protein